MMLMGFVCSSVVYGQTLMHSYTFDDGTANDVVGSAHGTVVGGTITDSAYTAAANGECIQLPAATIAINTYSSITLEGFFRADVDVTWASMMAYFGDTETETGHNYGFNYYFITPDRWTESRVAISCNNASSPWSAEQGVTGSPVSAGNKHHIVSTLTNSTISLYIDGVLVNTADVSGDNSIANLSNAQAWLCKGGYEDDPTWQGTIDKFNIYEGVLDENTIKKHYEDFVGDDFFNAKLSSLTTNTSTLTPAFDPEVYEYEVYVDYGISTLTLDAVTAIEGATIKMYDGLSNEIVDGIVTFPVDDGIDVEIIVTALDESTEESYYVSIFVNPGEQSAYLSSIDISTGNILNDFHPDTTDYTAIVPYGTSSVVVTANPSWDGANVTGDGTITLTNGHGTANITVTSEDELHTKQYSLDIYASKVTTGQYYYLQHETSKFVAEESLEDPYNVLWLSAPLKYEKTQLFEIIESGVADQYFLKNKNTSYLTLSPSSSWDMLMYDTLTQNLDSCRFILHEFEPGRFRIESVPKSPTEQKYMGTNNGNYNSWIFSDKYEDNTLAIWNILPPDDVIPYDTYLSDLSVTPGTLSPSFALYIKDYYVVLPIGTTSITVNATAHDVTSSVSGTGTIAAPNQQGTITVKVTASNPSYSTDYRIHYIKDTPLTLKHSYTFFNGTAQDTVGDAHGTVSGGVIKDGVYTASTNGHHISFPGDEIAINTYPSITVETYLKDETTTTNNVNTMVTYFGNTTGSYGTDYFFTSLKSRAAVSCNNTSNPWGTESGITGTNLLDDGLPHHLVSVLTYDTVILYIDGALVGQAAMSADNKIYNFSTNYAYLCKSGYTGDQTWMGQVFEYNIYSGTMDAETVALRASNFPVEDSTSDATLSDLMVDGVTIAGFASYKLDYTHYVSSGTTVVPTVTATTKYSNASALVIPATSIPDTTFIVVTAPDNVTKVTYSVFFDLSTDVAEPIVEKTYTLKVYPTVFNEWLKVESSIEMNAITIYDLTGKVVYKHVSKTYEHNIIAALSRGMYIVRVDFDGSTRAFKVFKSDY